MSEECLDRIRAVSHNLRLLSYCDDAIGRDACDVLHMLADTLDSATEQTADELDRASRAAEPKNNNRNHERIVVIQRLGELSIDEVDSYHNLSAIANAVWGSVPVAWTQRSCIALVGRLKWLLGGEDG